MGRKLERPRGPSSICKHCKEALHVACRSKQIYAECDRGKDALAHRDTSLARPPKRAEKGALEGVDTEAGTHSGISRERSIRSSPYWFTEFCNSQCSSHFAAPFIVVRAETSVAESCNSKLSWTTTLECMRSQIERVQRHSAARRRNGRRSDPGLLPSSF